ncbi:MAG: HI0074 family nucleotidyltransferase substrate-binding subunit [Pseudomonadota bacterium]
MDSPDIRWKQRFQQYEKAFVLLKEAIAIKHLSKIERAGLIQCFEMALELGWKLLKDFQEAEGFTIKTPRESIKQAFQANIIEHGHDWLDALEDRNLTSHVYQEKIALEVENKIRTKYYLLLENLYKNFKVK